VLLSGGLDSSLAAWLIKKQNLKVKALIFQSYFFNPEKGIKAAKQLKIPYQVIDFSDEHLEIVKKPKYGYGKASNPCIDCHLLMLKTARKILEKEGFDFVITGEVLGQRPFSQNRQALDIIAKKTGLGKRLLRPLSAKLLSPTLPEEKKWVNREKLLDIHGRSRKKQIALAKKIDLKYPQPAGGCILTEIKFAKKLFELKEEKPSFSGNDAGLLKIGRHFWIGKTKIIIGRNEEENRSLENLSQPKDILIQPANFIGPTALVRGKKIATKKAKKIILSYTKKKTLQTQPIVFFGSSQESVEILKTLLKEKIKIDLVITKSDRPAGRGQKLTPTPVAQFCQEKKLSVAKWEKLNHETLKKTEKKLKKKPILGIVAVYGNLIPQEWLDWFGMIINFHPSLLPKWRGAAPVIRSIKTGDKTTGITIFKIIKEMDAGPIIIQTKTKIKTDETSGQLIKRLFEMGTKKFIQLFKPDILVKKPGSWIMKPQDHTKATFAAKIDKQEAEIDWKKPVKQILNQIRAFNPSPGTYTFVKIKGKKLRLKIWQAHLEKGKLIPDEIQLEGKNRTSWQQFKQVYPNTTLKLIEPTIKKG